MYARPSLATASNQTLPSGPETIPTERTVKLYGLSAAASIGNSIGVPATLRRPMFPPTIVTESEPVVNQRFPSEWLVMYAGAEPAPIRYSVKRLLHMPSAQYAEGTQAGTHTGAPASPIELLPPIPPIRSRRPRFSNRPCRSTQRCRLLLHQTRARA